MGALAIGIIAGVVCLWGVTGLKRLLKADDSLDVFGVHGVGGIVGALLTGVFAAAECGGVGLAAGATIGGQVWAQAKSVLVTAIWSGVVSAVAFVVVDRLVGMRVAVEIERGGLDLAEHHEQAYEIV
jgi:Amt family ammonium transporter